MNSAIERAAALMTDFDAPWGFAGGWAIDLFVGRESRPHADVDIAILRADQQRLRGIISGRVQKVVSQQLADWSPTEVLQPPVHEVHVTWPDGYHLEFLLNEHDRAAGQWVFRRDARIRRALAAAFVSDSATPYLAPEIVLLYKAKAPTAKDDGDFYSVLPHLADEPRVWLCQALEIVAPGHRWATVLARES